MSVKCTDIRTCKSTRTETEGHEQCVFHKFFTIGKSVIVRIMVNFYIHLFPFHVWTQQFYGLPIDIKLWSSKNKSLVRFYGSE